MNCAICHQETVVVHAKDGERRRKCTACGHRFNTVEVLKAERARELEAVETVVAAASKLKTAA